MLPGHQRGIVGILQFFHGLFCQFQEICLTPEMGPSLS